MKNAVNGHERRIGIATSNHTTVSHRATARGQVRTSQVDKRDQGKSETHEQQLQRDGLDYALSYNCQHFSSPSLPVEAKGSSRTKPQTTADNTTLLCFGRCDGEERFHTPKVVLCGL